MMEARYYEKTEEGAVCLLCPHHCRIKDAGRGICRSRKCHDGILYALSYGKPCALAVDPVEKKPLNRYMPGTYCLSLSCTGCNLSCRWCQNSDISQVAPEDVDSTSLSPEAVVEMCLYRGLPSIAYTYTEPFTWWEYMYDIAVLAHDKGLKNILVSAGYIEKEPLPRNSCGPPPPAKAPPMDACRRQRRNCPRRRKGRSPNGRTHDARPAQARKP